MSRFRKIFRELLPFILLLALLFGLPALLFYLGYGDFLMQPVETEYMLDYEIRGLNQP